MGDELVEWVTDLDVTAGDPHRRTSASCCTPRLNAFLAEVRAATLDLGGRWDLDEEIRFARQDMIGTAGVVL